MALHQITIDTNQLLQSLSCHPTAILFVRGNSGCQTNNSDTEQERSVDSNQQCESELQDYRYILAIQPLMQSVDIDAVRSNNDFHGKPKIDDLDPHTQDIPTFLSGWAGLINYSQNFQQPLVAEFAYFDCVLYFNAERDKAILASRYVLTEQRITAYQLELKQLIMKSMELEASQPQQRHWQAQWTLEDYRQRFDRLQNYLIAGDCYQVNLTCPFTCADDLTNQSPLPLLNTFDAPMSGFFKHRHRWVTSVSPERFLKVKQGCLTTHPIKGTTPRSNDQAIDQDLRQQLIDSEKNQAENLMIVDLLRNDLSISAKPNSVQVTELFKVESHHNVHQMVSAITAQLKDDLQPLDAVLNAFPGGSITGAPKKRAMEIINELEIAERGAYCGSMGYIDDTGLTDFNILIRTIEATPKGAVCWGGGGITVQSTAEDEYNEILHKVGKILEHPL